MKRITAGAAITVFVASMIVPELAAQTFTTLHNFDSTDGAYPSAALVQATNGNLYSTTGGGGAHEGGSNIGGTVFKITPNGTLTTLYSFCAQHGCTDGESGYGLIQATDGNFYGMAAEGGANDACPDGCGTVFKVTPSGALTTLYSFCSQGGTLCTDGSSPQASLVQGTNGDFYGTTFQGGAVDFDFCGSGCGTVFKITPSGALTTLHSFCSQGGSFCTDGLLPGAGLVQATDGNFYGTTLQGGANFCQNQAGCGTVFKITPSGMLTTLYTFCAQSGCTDGFSPDAALIQASNGNLYGTTLGGGANGAGTIFKITLAGSLTTLYNFCSQSGCTDGYEPVAALVQATDGNFYGTTEYGGPANSACFGVGCGTVFRVSPSGMLTTLHSFCSQSGCPDGEYPEAALIQDTHGDFYGTTPEGGANGYGTVFSLDVGLGPFVEAQPTYGKVGAAIKMLGTNLTGATSVSFNGTAATFTVESGTYITTTVPAGATTGKVEVTLPSGTLLSNGNFQVLP